DPARAGRRASEAARSGGELPWTQSITTHRQPHRPPHGDAPNTLNDPEMQLRPPPVGMASTQCKSGDVLLSHNLSVAVPSALSGLTSGFGMGPGVSLTLWPP